MLDKNGSEKPGIAWHSGNQGLYRGLRFILGRWRNNSQTDRTERRQTTRMRSYLGINNYRRYALWKARKMIASYFSKPGHPSNDVHPADSSIVYEKLARIRKIQKAFVGKEKWRPVFRFRWWVWPLEEKTAGDLVAGVEGEALWRRQRRTRFKSGIFWTGSTVSIYFYRERATTVVNDLLAASTSLGGKQTAQKNLARCVTRFKTVPKDRIGRKMLFSL
ncbi:hypothetical protein EDD16DRAFT_1515438 [Pisolithus croceorrhizus]|nr:hypothetical protein EV401DRAFT_1890122 [Pisolithus croceorrhizus]KAI6130782.1 hypothetical protein EDD16DRAFT_1515438 [Pisolithus croceorrhizus]KAI6161266.1 hypothetical protein EDD17DRAFT_1826821 [Pisolithus thermaeus]